METPRPVAASRLFTLGDKTRDAIATVNDDMLAEVEQWQDGRLDAMYRVVGFGAVRLTIRDAGRIKNNVVYPASRFAPTTARKRRARESSKPKAQDSGSRCSTHRRIVVCPTS
jgi:hypothetical protein